MPFKEHTAFYHTDLLYICDYFPNTPSTYMHLYLHTSKSILIDKSMIPLVCKRNMRRND